jgi:hypothetical protein
MAIDLRLLAAALRARDRSPAAVRLPCSQRLPGPRSWRAGRRAIAAGVPLAEAVETVAALAA